MRARLLALLLATALMPARAAAATDAPRALGTTEPTLPRAPDPSPAPSGPLRYSWAVDGAVVVFTGAGWIISESLKGSSVIPDTGDGPGLAPATCRWCARNGLDDSVTRALAWGDIRAAATVGDVGGFAIAPLATLGTLALASNADDRLDEMPVNALLVLETVTVSSALNQIVKFSVGRERPFVADLPDAGKAGTDSPADNNLSFYSGHSNLVFALAVSSGTIAHLRGYEAEPYVWGVGLPVAAFVAYSRIAAKKHYLTDVLLGSATGAAIGFGLPWLFHRPAAESGITLAPLPNGAAVAGRW